MIDELVEGTTQRGFTGEDDFLEHGVDNVRKVSHFEK